MNKYTTQQVADTLKVSLRRVQAKIKQGHFPNAHLCSCGQSWLIPKKDVENNLKKENND